jgi:putative FMN-dependent luciferase-like monooxygenase
VTAPRLGFFTRVLGQGSPADRYRNALDQIDLADRVGFASVWIAQHHFGEREGGMPAPFVLLAAAAQRTTAIALGTAVLTLPLEDPVRAAEDAGVLDAISGGRLQLGVASGGTPGSFPPFGRDSGERRALFDEHLAVFLGALEGRGIRGTDVRMYPESADLGRRLWQGTFSADGGRRAAVRCDGLLLSRTQPRPAGTPDTPLHEVQLPIVDAYREALPDGMPARILASRTALVVDADRRTAALELAARDLRGFAGTIVGSETADRMGIDDLVRVTDTHVGTVDEVVASLTADLTLRAVTDVSFQVHSIDAPHELTLRSLELLATEVSPRLGFATGPDAADGLRLAHTRTASSPTDPTRAAPPPLVREDAR